MKLLSTILYQPKKAIGDFINKRIDHWLNKRVPGSFVHTLSSRNIFILPTRFGFAYLFFDVLLFLLGTNYQNNTILLFSYLLASLFITVMMHSFYNFSQITFSSTAKQYTYAKQVAYFPIKISVKKSHFDLNLHYANQSTLEHTISIEQCEEGNTQVLLPYETLQRGVYDLGRVKVYSEYSLGLFTTWAMLDFSHQLVVYPQPKSFSRNQHQLSGIDTAQEHQSSRQNVLSGIDDFAELKNHIVGESQARIAWKQLARGQGKLSKHYQSQQGSSLWLKLSDMPSTNIETKLSFLCFLILEYGKSEHDFGLLLDFDFIRPEKPLVKIKPSTGQQHQQNCLLALAEFKQGHID